MTSYILRTGSEVSVTAAPLVVQVQTGGRTIGYRWSPRGTTTEPPAITRPDRIVLPSITEPVTLRILPDPEQRFGSQSVISVLIRHDRPGPDADQVVLDDVDLSGLTHRDLVQFVPDGPQLRVVGLRTAADTRLPPVAEVARDAAREILGAPQVDDDDAVELSVLIDLSASMRPALSEGAVLGGCEVVAGVATVISPGRPLAGFAAGLEVHELGSVTPDRFAEALAAELTDARTASGGDLEVGTSTGFRSAVASATGSDRGRTVVISSGVPADWIEGQGRQLMILGAPGCSTDWPGAGSATVIDRGCLIDRSPGRRQIAAAVGSLLAHLLPGPGTEVADR